MTTSKCKHCGKHITQVGDLWKDASSVIPQYCWVDEVAGSKLHQPTIEIQDTPNHSGKKLSEVPFEDIVEGMEVTSFLNTPGRVKEARMYADGKSGCIFINWDNGKTSYNEHDRFDKVTVK